ncbi:MAG TPA: nitronate monooxygenase, partial [Blastocatellia bacterium]|nr:nitronate monooxygenase [Blastocatellia bacterium]
MRTLRVEDFTFLGVTPSGLLDPAIAIAASRARGVGILNLGPIVNEESALRAIARLARYGGPECGVKFEGNADQLVPKLIAELPKQIRTIVLTPADLERLEPTVVVLHERCIRVLLETTDAEQARAGRAAGVDGLVAKGNEAGGWVGEETTFILLQRLLLESDLPVWAQGGVGLHTAAACYVAGAAGVVLDSQLLLTRESPLSQVIRDHIVRLEGGETTCIGGNLGQRFRGYSRRGAHCLDKLRDGARRLESPDRSPKMASTWRREVNRHIGWQSLEDEILPLGQDVAFAGSLTKRFHTVGGIIQGIRESITEHLRSAKTLLPLAQGSSLAKSHRTDYPIAQGPMTRVSDTAAFAVEVAKNGALPFLALALMRAEEVKNLLEETREALGDRPWGVGILGFVPIELRQEQMEVLVAHKPPFALIAG